MNKLKLNVSVGNTLKIGRKEYLICEHDYILFNGACHQFIAGDRRQLEFKGWTSYSNVIIPKTTVAKIDLEAMSKKVTGTKEDRTLIIRYYFK